MSFDVYTALLKMFSEFHGNSDGIHLSYDSTNPELQEIRVKYGFDTIAGNGGDFSKAKNILHWVTSNVYHDGGQTVNIEPNAIKLLEYSFQNGKEKGLNCRSCAIILTECLLSIGIKARTVFLMPFSVYDGDNHVVTHAYIKEMNKWIMLDPSFDAYVMDKENQPLNLFEIREILADQEHIHFNKEIHHNDTEKWSEEEPFYKEYLAKDLYWFITPEKSCFNALKESRFVYIIPSAFDVKRREILNIEFRIKKQGEQEWLLNNLKNTREQIFDYVSPLDIVKVP